MDRYAVFVDAGYLLAAGSSALTGGPARPRHDLRLDCSQVITFLRDKGYALSDADELLRIYWYDGVLAAGLTTEQTTLGFSDNVKLRLGVVNGLGQQKGVDSRIVTDLAELARKGAITDAVLVSGDEDLRIGVEIAQEYGVRVHLLIVESNNPAPLLRREADTTNEISIAEVQGFLAIVQPPALVAAPTASPLAPAPVAANVPAAGATAHAACVRAYLATLDVPTQAALAEAIRVSGSIPREHDGRVLAQARAALGRDLDAVERADLRKELSAQLGV